MLGIYLILISIIYEDIYLDSIGRI